MYLFRFRDLVANTLQEHRKIIAAHRECWWGWWKRPTEDARRDVWDVMVSATSANPIGIGLFDSGSGEVFTAEVIAAVPPVDNAAERVPVPSTEIELIPAYYRDSPYSRAWMKLRNISDRPITFFERFSFAEVPRLPNFTDHALNSLRDKVIVSADELRAMDTTIWCIRPRREGDSDRVILVKGPGAPSPISPMPIECNANHILHITDPHFATGKNRAQHVWRLESERPERPSLALAITQALENAHLDDKIGLIIVTGDLTFTGSPDEFEETRLSLLRLLGNLNLGPEHLVVIPGNHDIQWTINEVYHENAEVTEASDDARKNYAKFYADLFRHAPNASLSMGRRYMLPCGLSVEIAALNSSSLATGENFLAGMGRVNDHSFTEVANVLGWTDKKTLALRVLALHHHLALTEDLEPAAGYLRGFGIAVDAPRVQRKAAKLGVQLALHGHKHRAFIWRSTVYQLPEFAHPQYHLGELSIVGGGSSGSSDTQAASNFFNVIEASQHGLRLHMFRSQNVNAFEEMGQCTGTFSIGDNGLTLSDWAIK